MSSQVTVTADIAFVVQAPATSADTNNPINRETLGMSLSFRALAPQGWRPQAKEPAQGSAARLPRGGGRTIHALCRRRAGKSAARQRGVPRPGLNSTGLEADTFHGIPSSGRPTRAGRGRGPAR